MGKVQIFLPMVILIQENILLVNQMVMEITNGKMETYIKGNFQMDRNMETENGDNLYQILYAIDSKEIIILIKNLDKEHSHGEAEINI